MKVNIVDTKGDFKKSVENDENPITIDEVVKSIENIQTKVGKHIMITLRKLRWSIKDLHQFVPLGVLDNELNAIIKGETVIIELSDM